MANPVERKEAHPQSPSAKWAKFQAGMAEHARREAEQLATRDRERKDSTEYHHLAEQQQKGAPNG